MSQPLPIRIGLVGFLRFSMRAGAYVVPLEPIGDSSACYTTLIGYVGCCAFVINVLPLQPLLVMVLLSHTTITPHSPKGVMVGGK